MKQIFFSLTVLMLATFGSFAQSSYEFTHSLQKGTATITAKTFFVDYGNGTGIARIRIDSPSGNDSTLIDCLATIENTDTVSGCTIANRLYLRLDKKQVMFGTDSGLTIPKYFVFTLNAGSGFFEPFGTGAGINNCQAIVTPFSAIRNLEKKDLNKQYVMRYFTNRDKFFNALFAIQDRDLTVLGQNVKIYLLVVANTFDDSIGSACAKDMRRAINFFTDIRDFLGMQFEYDTITGKNFDLTHVNNAIERLERAGKNDIVVFYYTGHGFRPAQNYAKRPPCIDLRTNQDIHSKDFENPNVLSSKSLQDIYDRIKQMPARLSLVIGDCCNDSMKYYNIKANAPMATKGGFGLTGNTQIAADLFLNATKISMLATGAEAGQKSICNDDFGGFFSYNLWEAISGQIKNSGSNNLWNVDQLQTVGKSWDNVKNYTKINTQKLARRVDCPMPDNPQNRCYQTPYILLEINGREFR